MNKSLTDFLRTAMEPVGSTMYIWGGGWNSEDSGAGKDAKIIGVNPNWKKFFMSQGSDYDYKEHRYEHRNGLDCSGYVGWVMYNFFEDKNGAGSDYVTNAKNQGKLFAEMGFKMYRMSINWTRIYPNGDDEKPNEAGLQHYRKVFELCKSYNIEPLVTMSHYEFPYHLTKKWNGWEDRRTIDCFVKYTKTIMEAYKDLVTYWITFNEQNIFTSQGWSLATHPPGKRDMKLFYQVNHIANLANAAVINKFHELEMDG